MLCFVRSGPLLLSVHLAILCFYYYLYFFIPDGVSVPASTEALCTANSDFFFLFKFYLKQKNKKGNQNPIFRDSTNALHVYLH